MPEKKPLGYMLAKLHRLHLAKVKEKTCSLGIPPGLLPILITLLAQDTPLTQEAVAALVLVDKSVAARGINQLEKKGFLRRYTNPENRRQKLVQPTPLAEKIKDDLFAALEQSSEALLTALPPKDQDQVIALLGKMLDSALG